MENLKVKVSSEAESKEAQELFFELGFEKGMVCGNYPNTIVAIVDSKIIDYHFSSSATELEHREHKYYKELTLHQLRDLVVLKRNDVGGATHKGSITDNVYYVSSDEEVYRFESSAWCFSTVIVADLKPIEKKEMKETKQAEFLVKTDNGYVLQVLDENSGGADVVRIPDGAEIAVKSSRGYIEFRKGNSFYAEEWCEGSWHVNDFPKHEWDIVWKRETLNDQVASAEEYRNMISNAASIGRVSVVADLAQSCGGAIRNASLQGQSDFPLNNHELNHRVAKGFNAVRGTNLNEDDVNYIRELIDLTIFHYGERK